MSEDKKNTIRAERRRKPTTEADQRQQAPTPKRRQPTSGGSGGSGGTGQRPPSSGSSGGGGLGGRSPAAIGVIVVIALCLFVAQMFLGGDGDEGGTAVSDLPPASDSSSVERPPTSTPRSFTPPETGDGQTWTIMLYQDADDKILEQDIYLDLNEAERIGSTDRVQIVAQVDRYQAGYQGDGNWSGTRRYFVTQDNDLNRVGSPVVQDLGEANMADGQTLIDFVTWAVDNYPADKYALIMSDHGMGWPGGWSDPDPGAPGDPSIPLAERLGDNLYLMEIDDALEQIRQQTGIDKFELIGMDACLMAHLEVFSALAPHARYAVASQEVEPALGWAYTGLLEALASNPNMDGAGLGQAIVDSYIVDDQRIVDDVARQEFLQRGSPIGGLFDLLLGGGGGGSTMSADGLAQEMSKGVTLTAVDLSAIEPLMESFNSFTFSLQNTDQRAIAQARSYAQSYTSIFGKDVPASYIDLGHFAQLVAETSRSSEITGKAEALLLAINQSVVAEIHGPNKPGSSGISIYFPNSDLYRSPITGAQSYTAMSSRFVEDALWDEFLSFHYTGNDFDFGSRGATVPSTTAVRSPVAGQITVSPIQASAAVASPSNPILLSSDISGANVGYVYLFVGFYDQSANSILLADADYLESNDTRQINGVYYPVWDTDFTLEFEWEPIVFAISDGTNSVVARFQPQNYGATFEEAIYTVDGTYIYANDGETRHARLFFQNGNLRQVFGFTGADGNGAPREIIPQTGDTFTVQEQWLDLNAEGNVTETAVQDGGTLTFGDQMFTWQDLNAAPGQYVVGFIVEDLDGNQIETFIPVTVQ